MQKIRLRLLTLSIATLFVATCVPVVAFAEDGSSGSGSDDTTATNSTTEAENETETHTGSLRDRLQELKTKREENQQNRLDAVKEKVCENRKQHIASIMDRSITRANKQLDLFSTIATRVEAFYVNKGKTLANYDELVTAVNNAKTKAQGDFDTLKGQTTFDCNGSDPKGQVEAFKTALQSVNQDLKDYRTAVKNLIVGVKSVQGTESSNKEGSQQ
ncbi:MAG TPA: hypothetical protein VL737_05205 [Candidatus Pristimantibacillus sp.]|nr:hypothetical protein [Candidatus Pristimantibacillus sp.]